MKKSNTGMKGKVYFIGAGPGDPELITVKGKKVIDSVSCIIYAGSLVNPLLFRDSNAEEIHDSSSLNLDQIVSLMEATVASGRNIARVHTGDPSIYGAIKEQMMRLDSLNIDYEVIPGVSSAFGASAALNAELTMPEVSQTLIITRKGGRTPVPEKEHLSGLASHNCTMMIFLSVSMIDEIVADLLKGGYGKQTPVRVVQRATWPDEKIISGTLEDIAGKSRAVGIQKTAIICVGSVFNEDSFVAESKLYNKYFSHGTREAEKAQGHDE